jgi:hypothetical protein
VSHVLEAPLTARFDCRVFQIDRSLLRCFWRNFHIYSVRPIKNDLAGLSGNFRWFVVELIVRHAGKKALAPVWFLAGCLRRKAAGSLWRWFEGILGVGFLVLAGRVGAQRI